MVLSDLILRLMKHLLFIFQPHQHIYKQVAFDREKTLLTHYQKDSTKLIIFRPSNTIVKRDTAFY